MALRMKPTPPNPELDRRLKESAKEVGAMAPAEKEAMMRVQMQSWARQDID